MTWSNSNRDKKFDEAMTTIVHRMKRIVETGAAAPK